MKRFVIGLVLLAASAAAKAHSGLIVKTPTIHIGDSLPVFSSEELLGRFDPAKHPDFVLIAKEHSGKEGLRLRRQAYEAFKLMHAAAAKEGITLKIISATRNFEHQKTIWNRKWNLEKYKGLSTTARASEILKYSSMPGTSRHHWGTDIDLNSLEPAYFTKGEGKKIHDWLSAYGPAFGFAQTYTSKANGRSGYEEEAWHWSYMPIAGPMLQQYNTSITYDQLTGFNGSDAAAALRIIELFVNGIDNTLKK